jgi:hypothetical protein
MFVRDTHIAFHIIIANITLKKEKCIKRTKERGSKKDNGEGRQRAKAGKNGGSVAR